MIWAFILRLWGGLRRIGRIAAAYPWQAACVALVLTSVWLWQAKQAAQDRAERCAAQVKAERAAYVAAQEQARIKAEMALRAQEARFKEKADNADKAHAKALVDASRAADRYIAANRVRIEAAQGSAGGTVASAESGSAGSPDSASAAAFMVAVTENDVRICTANTQRPFAREWALGVND